MADYVHRGCVRGAKGHDVEHVLELNFKEPVTVDGDRIVELCVGMGEVRAEEMIALSIDNLWRGLEGLKEAYRAQRMDEIANISKGLSQIADNLGLGLFARVARDVEACADRMDGPALAGSLCRLLRVADSSLSSIWELCDISG
jgi:hypothetical protein